MDLHVELKILFAFILSFLIVYLAIPTIIRVAKMTQWLDRPSERKIHSQPVPRLAGVAIFTGIGISTLFFLQYPEFHAINYYMISLIILFFIGLKDDILVTAPFTKFMGQLVAVLIVIIYGNIRITNMHGFFHIFHIPSGIGVPLTALIMLVIINAFNFIDGIDGLAATIAIEVAVTLGIWFYNRDVYQYTVLAAILVGALLAYLRYNLSSGEKKIFMGDTGTMLIGLTISVLAIEFNQYVLRFSDLRYFPAPAVSFGIMIIPFYDLVRIVFIRTITGKKFYEPDRNHIHHIFLRLGFSQRQTLVILAAINLIFIFLSFYLARYFTIRRLLLILLILIGVIIYIPSHILRKREENGTVGL